jgi:polysaccharide biosynthesis/export protein
MRIIAMWFVIALSLAIPLFVPEAFGQKANNTGGRFREAMGYPNDKSRSLDTNQFLLMSKLSTDYELGVGDVLKIEIVGQDALNASLQSLRISNSGEIGIPYLDNIKAADLTASQLEAKIASELKVRELAKNPEVLVWVTDYQAKRFYVLGKVDNPGEYVMTQQLTITEAIMMAGGIDILEAGSRGADRYGFIHRRLSPGASDWKPVGNSIIDNPEIARSGREVIKIDLQPLLEGGILKPDVLIREGDVIVVPERKVEFVCVVGDVRVPGAYRLTYPKMRVSQAIIGAGGPTPTAKANNALLIRSGKDGKREEYKVDFEAILKGSQPELEVRPDDIIFVPGSRAKTLGLGFLGIIPQTVQRQTTQSIQR